MRLNLKNFINSDETVLKLKGELDSYQTDYDTADLGLIMPIKYDAVIYDMGKELMLDLNLEYKYNTQCDRCLKPIIKCEVSELKAYFRLDDELEYEDSADAQYFDLVNQEIELDDIIISQIITDRPFKNLCDEDCKGLCPKCGKNLNEGQCDCVDDSGIDLRFEKILDLFNDEEV
ncbi:MAG: DUF177 domain-containing protein [Peptoniphilus sp.]|nr:DUF177 domain-containing protein [Peptoniphilus sp.]